MDQQGQLMSLYDVLEQVAKIWPNLTTNEKDYFLLQQAGANQTQNLAAILSNFKTATDATTVALDSAGSATQENARYMESLEAQTQQLKATFQDLSNNVIDNELVGSILNLANKGLELLNTDVGRAIVQWTLLTGTLTGSISIFGTIGSHLATMAKAGIATAIAEFKNLALVASGAAGPLMAVGTGFTSLASAALPVAGIIAAIGVAGYALYKAYQDANPTLEEATQNIENINSSLQSNKDRLEEINGLQWYEKTPEILKEKEALEQQNVELERQIGLLQQRKVEAAQDVLSSGKISTGSQGFAVTLDTGGGVKETVKEFESYGEALDYLTDKFGSLEEAQRLYYDIQKDTNLSFEGTSEEIQNYLISSLSDLQNQLNKTGQLNEEELNRYNILTAEAQKWSGALEAAGQKNQELDSVLNNLVSTYDNIVNKTQEANNAFNNAYNGLLLNEQEYKNLILVMPQISSMLTKTTDGWKLDTDAVLDAAANGEKWATQAITNQKNVTKETVTQIENRIKLYEAEMQAMLASQGGRIGTSLATQEDVDKYMDLFKASTRLQGILAKVKNTLSNVTATGTSGATNTKKTTSSTSSSATKQKTDEALKVFQEYYKDLKHLREIDQADDAKYYGDLRWWVDWYTKTATENMKKYGLDAKTIKQNMYQYEEELYKHMEEIQKESLERQKQEWQDYIDELNSEKSDMDAVISYATEYAQRQIDALQEEKSLIKDEISDIEEYYDAKISGLEESNDKLDQQIQREQLLQNLEKAKATQVRVYKDGQFTYQQDADAVSAAQSALTEFDRAQTLEDQKAYYEQLKQQDIDRVWQKHNTNAEEIDSEIKKWQDYKENWSNINSDYEYSQNELIAKQKYGIDIEKANWDTRLENLNSFAQQYIATLNSISAAQARLNGLKAGGASGGSTSSGGGGYSFSGVGVNHWTEAEMNEGFVSSGGSSKSSKKKSASQMRSEAEAALAKSKATGKKVSLGGGVSIDYSKVKKHAKGALNTPGGLSLVGEQGPELRVLNNGDGVLPNDITKNLWAWGSMSPSSLLNSLGTAGGVSMSGVNMSFPNVRNGSDAKDFMTNVVNLAYQRAYKRN